jgi:hypothetical protein
MSDETALILFSLTTVFLIVLSGFIYNYIKRVKVNEKF